MASGNFQRTIEMDGVLCNALLSFIDIRHCRHTIHGICLENFLRAKDVTHLHGTHTHGVCYELPQVKFIKLSPETINTHTYATECILSFIHSRTHLFIYLLIWFIGGVCVEFSFFETFYPAIPSIPFKYCTQWHNFPFFHPLEPK